VEVVEWYTTVCHMTRSKVKITEVWNVRKLPISKSISSANMHVIEGLTVNYDTPRPYLNFVWRDFWYSSSFGVTWPSNLGCHEKSTGSLVWGQILLCKPLGQRGWLNTDRHILDWLNRADVWLTYLSSCVDNRSVADQHLKHFCLVATGCQMKWRLAAHRGGVRVTATL